MQDVLGKPQARTVSWQQILTYLLTCGILLVLWIGSGLLVPAALAPYSGQSRGFVTIFLGIFIEALPFLLAGVLLSAALHSFVTPAHLQRLLPRNPVAGALLGALLGLIFPVCECGSVPAARRLMHKGAPLPLGIAFVLASPVVNPTVIISTAVAFAGIFGWGFVAWRVGLTIAVAVAVGLVIGRTADPQEVLADGVLGSHNHHDHSALQGGSPLAQVLNHAGEEFFEMSRYLVIGGMLAAGLQTFVPPALLVDLARGEFGSVVVMMALAVLLSICSTVDSFVALSFADTFAPGALLAFLVFGPMVDIKSALMFTSTFKRGTVARMISLITLLILLATLGINWYG